MLPQLWWLATFTPRGQINPMGGTLWLMAGLFSGWVGLLLCVHADRLSQRPLARVASWMALLVLSLPFLNLMLFLVIVFVRGISFSG